MSHLRARYSLGSAGAALAALAILGPGTVIASPGVSPAASAVAFKALSASVSVTHAKTTTKSGGTSTTKATGHTLTANATDASSSTIGLWAADWGGAAASRTTAGWQAAAMNDSVLIGEPGVYKKWIPQLKAWNPSVTVLEYNLGPYLQKGSANFTTILASDPSWFAHDSHGNLINLPSFPNNYLMDPGNAGYRAWHSSQLAASVAQYGFDGAMDDSMGAGPLGHYASAPPVDTATGLPYTVDQWLDSQVLMLNSDKAALNGKYLAFNGLVSGPMFVRESSILATSNADAGVSELFLRQPTAPVTSYPNATALADSLTMMSDMAANGKTFLGWTKVWSTATPAQVSQWEQFDLGVYLLGQEPGSMLDFMPSHSADNTAVSYPNLQEDMGTPMGPYSVNGTTYTRVFQNGTVTVNLATSSSTIQMNS
jgi:putative glycosyl hydrolase-like family 15 (GHL15) protein